MTVVGLNDRILLRSFDPGSGNTWTRHILDFATGVPTGSIHKLTRPSPLPGQGVCDQRVGGAIDALHACPPCLPACLLASRSVGRSVGLSFPAPQSAPTLTLTHLPTPNDTRQVSVVKAHPNQFRPNVLLDLSKTGPAGACVVKIRM